MQCIYGKAIDEIYNWFMADIGRPRIEIDMEQLAALCRMKPTLEDCAAFFKCSPNTIENRIKEETGLTFCDFRAQNIVHTRFDLARTAIQKAKDGDNTMLIWCMKNMNGWTDKVETHNTNETTISIKEYSDEELDAELKQLEEPKDDQT